MFLSFEGGKLLNNRQKKFLVTHVIDCDVEFSALLFLI